MTTNIIETDTVVIGAGQAGVATSEHLSRLGVPHLVLERNRIAERWRSERWDSLVANGPAWHDRFPGLEFDDFDDDDFVPKEKVADYFKKYVEKFDLPVREGVEVKNVKRNPNGAGFIITTATETINARHVVVATGPFQQPGIPPIAPADDEIHQIHSTKYKKPEQMPDGAVLVVGAGSSGVQIADELNRSGRDVYLSVGPHDRPPRSYRGRDFVWWLGVLGIWDMETPAPGTEHVTIAVTGAHGFNGTVNFRDLGNQGIKLVGRTKDFKGGKVSFNDDLVTNVNAGDAKYLEILDLADEYIKRNQLDLPEEPEARKKFADPYCITNPIREIDLEVANIKSIIWATGFKSDYKWLDVDAFDEKGNPNHARGVSTEQGIYFVGLPWQSRRGSSFIWGVWHDAKYVADHICIQQTYYHYHEKSKR